MPIRTFFVSYSAALWQWRGQPVIEMGPRNVQAAEIFFPDIFSAASVHCLQNRRGRGLWEHRFLPPTVTSFHLTENEVEFVELWSELWVLLDLMFSHRLADFWWCCLSSTAIWVSGGGGTYVLMIIAWVCYRRATVKYFDLTCILVFAVLWLMTCHKYHKQITFLPFFL